MPIEIATPEQLQARCQRLPVFPLPRVVFLPHTLLPLHVFEPRYRALVADLVEGDGLLGVPTLAPGWQPEYDRSPGLHPIFGVGQLVRHQAMPDGCSNIVLVGLGRAALGDEHDTEHPYRVVEAQLLADEPPAGGAAALSRARTQLAMAIGQIMQVRPESAEHLSTLMAPEREAHEMVDALAHLALRTPEDRQSYLELPGVVERVDRVLSHVADLLVEAPPPGAAGGD